MRLSCLVLLLALGACGSQAPLEPKEPMAAPLPEDVETGITGAIEQYRQSYQVRSPEALAALYDHSLDLVVVFQGRAHLGWSQVETFLQGRLQGASKVRMTIKDLHIQSLAPGSAVASAGLETTIGDEATSVTERGTLTLAFRSVDGVWKIVSEHFSYPTSAR